MGRAQEIEVFEGFRALGFECRSTQRAGNTGGLAHDICNMLADQASFKGFLSGGSIRSL